MSNKNWKDFLLSSGLPLEYSVIKILEKLDISSPEEYSYERKNELGLPAYFSVDINAEQYIISNDDVISILDLLIECKYRHDDVKWIFTPQKIKSIVPQPWEVFITLDVLSRKRIDKKYLTDYINKYSVCRKGIELLSDSFNPKSIDQAIHQLKFGVSKRIIQQYSRQVHSIDSSFDRPVTLLPIIVTTADLWILKEDISLEELKSENEIENVAIQQDSLLLYHPPDNELVNFTKDRFDSEVNSNDVLKVNKFLKKINTNAIESHRSQKYTISSYYPCYFAIINYKAFEREISNIFKIFKKDIYFEASDKEHDYIDIKLGDPPF